MIFPLEVKGMFHHKRIRNVSAKAIFEVQFSLLYYPLTQI